MTLKLDWATHAAAKFACEKWHYTKKIPVNKLVKIGVWEDDKFKGVVIFGVGASAVLHKQFNLTRFEVCELVRVALDTHATPVTRIISIALRFLQKANPALKLCVSFADPSQGHHGGIYQGGGWMFTGVSSPTLEYWYNGDWRHVTDVYKRLSPERVKTLKKRTKPGKYRYIMALDPVLKQKLVSQAKPYPKRASSVESGTSLFQGERGGESPTDALQSRKIRESSVKRKNG